MWLARIADPFDISYDGRSAALITQWSDALSVCFWNDRDIDARCHELVQLDNYSIRNFNNDLIISRAIMFYLKTENFRHYYQSLDKFWPYHQNFENYLPKNW